MEVKKPTIKSIPYEDFKDNEYIEHLVDELKQLNEGGTKVLVGCLDDLINWGRRIRCGRLHLQPVVVESSLWQWVLPGMISPASGLK